MLSPVAAAKLASAGEAITVTAQFYGIPISKHERASDQRRADLAPEEAVVLTGAGTASFLTPRIDPSRLRSVEAEQVDVAFRVSSGDRTTEHNLLDCDTSADQSIEATTAKLVQIHCKLTGENESMSTAIGMAALLRYFR
jgi:hypothetical protein